MAIQPYMPPKKDTLGKALTLGGLIAGAAAPAAFGASSALTGASAGAGLGSLAGSLAQGPQPQPMPSAEQQGMQRRMEQNQQDPVTALRQAQAALASLPPEQFQTTRQTFDQAMALARRNQQYGVA